MSTSYNPNLSSRDLVLFDLGDTLMIEETEHKDADGVTLRADLLPDAPALLHDLKERGVILGMVADTRIGTYQNVLSQHGLYDLFDLYTISEELGTEKPDARMFHHALDIALTLGWSGQALMVGNNYTRDILGAKSCGLWTLWLHWNTRYPIPDVPDAADWTATSLAEAQRVIVHWMEGRTA